MSALPAFRPCDLCGAGSARFVMNAPDLDGPLVECDACGFRYVGIRRSSLAFGQEAPEETARRVLNANEHFRPLQLHEEHRLARLNSEWRLKLIRKFRSRGRMVEVGCGRGDFIEAASAHFDALGVEPNPALAADASTRGRIFQGTIENLPESGFDVAATFHVIEHVDAPRSFINEIARRLLPGGLLVIETPNIDSLPFRLFGPRWRQFIPEHYSFFSPQTMERLCRDAGFEVQSTMSVGKYASAELLFNRLSRFVPMKDAMEAVIRRSALRQLTFRINPLDIMLTFATKQRS